MTKRKEVSELTLEVSDAYEINLPISFKAIVPKTHIWLTELMALYDEATKEKKLFETYSDDKRNE